MEKKIELTDDLVIPVMVKFNIERHEAETRLQLLYKTGIIINGSPDDKETQQMIDDFLKLPSEEAAGKIVYEQVLNQCLENKEFISSYSKLRNKSFAQTLREIETGTETKATLKEFKKFSNFVRETVFLRLQPPYINLIA